jgi:hypothetical protein
MGWRFRAGIRTVLTWLPRSVLLASFLALPGLAAAQTYVRSVQYVEISLGTSETTKSANLTKGQTIANCVPFASSTVNNLDDDFDQLFTDVYFEAGPKVTARRQVSGGTIDLGIYVVEFDPTYVTVQQNSTALSFNTTSTTTSITSVNPAKAAMVFYYRGSFTSHEWQDHAVAGWISGATNNTLSFQRDSNIGTVTLHWYVFEAKNSEFSVQPVSFSLPADEFFATASISSVDPTKTFVIGSFRTPYDDDNVRSTATTLHLSDVDEVRAERGYDSGDPISNIRAFVVTLSGDVSVQRNALSYGTSAQTTATVSSVSTDHAIVWNGMSTGPGVMKSTDGDGEDVETGFQRIKLTDATTVQGNRTADTGGTYTGTTGTGRFEVIDFSGVTTEVKLVSFDATGYDGAVELRWETGSELDNLGFHLYRSSVEEGPYERITGNPIPGLGSSVQGARYSHVDSDLTNGETYYYRLEDIETRGVMNLHGPVSATPEAGATAVIVDPEEEGSEENESSRITYGSPWENEVRFRRNGRNGAVVELITRGFYAYPEADGTVRLEVPGLELVAEPGEPWVPVYRGWLDAVAGRKVTLRAVRVDDVQEFTSLRPSAADAPVVIASSDGTVEAGVKKVKRAFLYQDGLYPGEPARLADVAFQQGEKKALLELAPLRWDELGGRLLMAGRLQVRVSFDGREPSEKVVAGGSRRHVENHARRNVLAQLVTQEAGLHGVRFEDLFGSDGKPRKTNELRLSRQGEAVAFRVVPGSSTFARGSTLYFISEGADANPYGDEAVYELESSRSGVQMERVIGAPSGSPVSHYWKTVRREENRLYQAAYIEAEDVWQWDWIFGPMTKSFPFQLTDLESVSDPAQLDIWLQGASDFPQEPDHHVRVYVNGTLVAEEWWDGESGVHLTAELFAGVLHEGENILQVQEVGDTDALYSMIMLDRFEVKYPAELTAHEGELKGSFSQSGTAWLSNLGKGFVFDLTAEHPSWLDRVNHAEGLGFGTVEGHQYLAVGEDAVRSPEVRKPLRTSLRSEANAAEYLVIGPRAFLSAAEPLLRYRMNEGLRTKAVAVEDVFAEFGYGEATPEAVHDFLSYAYHHWTEPSPRYVLLLGDSTYDTKDYEMGTKDYRPAAILNRVPVKLVKTRYMWTASDPWLAAVNGEDLLPDVAIGRLPAASVDEVKAMVEKILVYETGESDPGSPIVLITDNPDSAGDFDWNADVLAATVLSGQNIEKVYLSELGTTATRSAIRNAFDDGASVMSYIGHGAIHMWANENLLNIGNVASLSPQSQQPILFTMNCLNGYFHFPYHDSLSERLLKADGKGVIAAFSPTGLSLDEPAHRFHRALLDHVVNLDHERLGDAILAGQSDYADSGAFPELLSIYHLLGDPALRLK